MQKKRSRSSYVSASIWVLCAIFMFGLSACYSVTFQNLSDTPHAQFGPSGGEILGHFDEVRHIHIALFGLLNGEDFDLHQFLQDEIKSKGGSSVSNLTLVQKHTPMDEVVTIVTLLTYFQTSVEVTGDVMK